MPASGAAFVASKIDAIAANRQVWAKTAFILDYDENDGIFDHVVLPVPPSDTRHEFVLGQPIGAGFRVELKNFQIITGILSTRLICKDN